jgi:hypothetical protein
MLNKTLCALLVFGLILTTNFSVLAQTQSTDLKNSPPLNVISKKEFLDNFGVAHSDRANELFDKDSFVKVKKDIITAKAMQDADKGQQKKKFSGINTTTAIIIGGVLVAAIIIVLATKGSKERQTGQIFCDGIRSPCP